MKLFTGSTLVVWWNLVFAATSTEVNTELEGLVSKLVHSREDRILRDDNLANTEEREILKFASSRVGELGGLSQSSIEGLSSLAQNSKTWDNKTANEIAWEVANTVVPIIGTALALIPGVGPLVSGVFLGVWGLVSSLFSPKKPEAEENAMEKMINKMADTLRKEMDQKLGNFIKVAIYGEISRNTYICNKYAFVTGLFSKNFNTSTKLEPIDAIHVKMYMNDCDNFLKDTAEAFAYDEYADVLWVPSAITTFARLGFLAETIRNAPLIGLMQNVTIVYLQEIKTDIQRHFDYHRKGMDLTLKRNETTTLENVSTVVKSACKIQGQFFYLDAVLYPYGIPTIINNTKQNADIKLPDYYKPANDSDKERHLQFIFQHQAGHYLDFMNCFLGEMYQKAPLNEFRFSFYPMKAKNRFSYEFRVMYLEFEDYYKKGKVKPRIPVLGTREDYEETGLTTLNIMFLSSDDERTLQSEKLIDVSGFSYFNECPFKDAFGSFPNEIESVGYKGCENFKNLFPGRFKMYSAGIFNHKKEKFHEKDQAVPRYTIVGIYERGERHYTYLLGMEIIIRPLIQTSGLSNN